MKRIFLSIAAFFIPWLIMSLILGLIEPFRMTWLIFLFCIYILTVVCVYAAWKIDRKSLFTMAAGVLTSPVFMYIYECEQNSKNNTGFFKNAHFYTVIIALLYALPGAIVAVVLAFLDKDGNMGFASRDERKIYASLEVTPNDSGTIADNDYHEQLERVDISDGITAFVMRCNFIAKSKSATGDIILDVLNTKEERTITIKLGIYADKTLVAMISKDINIEHGQNTVSFTQISCSVIPKKQYTAKVYLWNELNTAKLICEPIELGAGMAGGTIDNG